MRPGSKSLVEGIDFLTALHCQLLNIPDVRQQKLETYGVMCPRWATEAGVPEADARALIVDILRRRAMQSVPILAAIKALRELLHEHELAHSIPASDLEGEQPGGGE